MSAPVIRDGAVSIAGGRIVAVGRWKDLAGQRRSRTVDLGEVALLPGLINAHCHLDYTLMAGQLPPPKTFPDWLKAITETKAGWTRSDYLRSWRHGAGMLVRTGTTTVADVEAVPSLLPQAWRSTPLRVISLLEMIGIKKERLPRVVLQEALDKAASLGRSQPRIGLSPHAPYSTVPELLRLSAIEARRRRWPICTHLAESAIEFEMFTEARGEMYDWLARSGRDMADCGHGSPVRHAERCGLLHDNLLAAHVNYLARSDAALLGKRSVSVVHCPRSHAYFRHGPFPLQRLLRAGVNLCLGTDSLASVYKTRRQAVELSMFDEMRALADREPTLSPARILALATINGARALGQGGRLGVLAPGAGADLIAVPLPEAGGSIPGRILERTTRVGASMIAGHWALAPGAAEPGTVEHLPRS